MLEQFGQGIIYPDIYFVLGVVPISDAWPCVKSFSSPVRFWGRCGNAVLIQQRVVVFGTVNVVCLSNTAACSKYVACEGAPGAIEEAPL